MKNPTVILKNKQMKDFSTTHIAGQRVVYFISTDFLFSLVKGNVLWLHRPTKRCESIFMVVQVINFRWCGQRKGYVIQAYEKGFIRRTKGMNFE